MGCKRPIFFLANKTGSLVKGGVHMEQFILLCILIGCLIWMSEEHNKESKK